MDRNCYLDNIEITQAKSLSARRAWIEIRDLKYKPDQTIVALRKESVDRNKALIVLTEQLNRSLSARRAWIEIFYRLHY